MKGIQDKNSITYLFWLIFYYFLQMIFRLTPPASAAKRNGKLLNQTLFLFRIPFKLNLSKKKTFQNHKYHISAYNTRWYYFFSWPCFQRYYSREVLIQEEFVIFCTICVCTKSEVILDY